MSENRLNTRELAEISILVALAIVLNQIKVWQMPQGGSVTLASMIPVMLLSYRRGVKVGIIGGIVFGLVQMVIEGYVYYPLQIILDYPLAFACLGFAGIFKKLPPLGVILSMVGRFLCHLVSGAVFFAEYAPSGQSPWLYSAVYNGGYLFVEMVISVVLIYFIWKKQPQLLNT